MTYASEDLLDQLRREREGRRISQRGLSQRSGITQSHISQIESGKLEPGLSSFLALARSLDLEAVLVPRKLLPAVTGVLRAHRPVDQGPDDRTRKAIDNALVHIQSSQGETTDMETLDRLSKALVMLRSAPLAPGDQDLLRAALDLLADKRAAVSQDVLANAANILWPVRNKIAHATRGTPRPAYALTEDDSDA
jgi:transcriptional regulator with XRE-family HTH domain